MEKTNELLVALYQVTKDKTVLAEILEKNKHAVIKICNTYKTEYLNSLEYDDLIQTANMGLIAAVNKYNCNLENKATFFTFAYHYIRGYVQRLIRNNDTSFEKSLNTTLNDEVYTELIDTLEDPEDYAEKVEEKIDNIILRKEVKAAIKENLTLYQGQIIELHYGIGASKSMTFTEIAEIFDSNYNNVLREEGKGLRKLRNSSWGREKSKTLLADRKKQIETNRYSSFVCNEIYNNYISGKNIKAEL